MDFYCKIYLKVGGNLEELKELLANLLRGSVEGRTIIAQGVLVDPFENKAADQGDEANADFLFWPYYLEVEAEDENEMSSENFIHIVSVLLRELKIKGVQVVPCCDFESQLADAVSAG